MIFAIPIAAVKNIGRVMRNEAAFAEHDGEIFDVRRNPVIQTMGLFAAVGHAFGELIGEGLDLVIRLGFVCLLYTSRCV